MAMASSSPPTTIGTQPTLVPYEPTRDCSQGLCTLYCPQWCYLVFPPPPPPFEITGPGPDDSSGPAFSPLVIAIIGVLASAFLLVAYYTIISKYCGTFSSLQNRILGADHAADAGGGGHGEHRSQEPWNVSPSDGLDAALIRKITVCKYKRGDGFVDSTDCPVCLGEFRDGESLRLLPKCSHAFHLPCIDTWLKSHSNCPLCRCNIAFVTVGMASPEPDCRAPGEDFRDNHEVAVPVDDLETAREEQRNMVSSNHGDGPGRMEEANGIVEIREDGLPPVRGPSSSDAHRDGRMSVADVLQASMEDELTAARESGRSSHDTTNHVPAKRLVPGGRSCFSNKNGSGKDSVLPM